MKPCEWCDNTFKPKVSYQIYCSTECREQATKQKIAERYIATQRERWKKKPRKCAGGCGTELSIYNTDGFCTKCFVNKKEVDKMMKKLKGIISYEQE